MKIPRYSFLLCIILLLAGCKDDVNLNTFNQESRLVVYCFPSPGDTTYMRITRSIPVRYYADSVKVEQVDDASVVYTVNGTPCTVTPIGRGYYRITGHQRVGDNVSLHVSARNGQEVTASTAIPDTVAVGHIQMREVKLKNKYSNRSDTYKQVMATFTDDAATHRYYGVRVKHTASNTNIIDETRFTYPSLNIESEPLLSPLTDIDDEFGYSNDYFGNFYIFDDASINGQTYTLHLNIASYGGAWGSNHFYQVELICITPEYYRFMLALNQINNDELAKDGLSQIRPTVTNMSGGLGLLGGWSASHTQWIKDI